MIRKLLEDEGVVYRPGVDMCPLCDTAIYHNKGCVIGALLRENERLRNVNHAAAFAELVEAGKITVSAMKARMDNEGLPYKDDDLIRILDAALRRVEG